MGISLRRFLGWEPRVFTRQDEEGLAVSVPEVEYDVWEQQLQLAYDTVFCPGCGQPLDEALLDEKVPPEERVKYKAGFVQCRACEVLELSMSKQEETDAARKKQSQQPFATRHRQWKVVKSH